MRVFIGISAKVLKDNYLKFRNENSDVKMNWFHPDDLHITLIPPWKTQNIEEEISKLNVFKGIFSSFNTDLDTLEGRKGLVWVCGPASNKLTKIKTTLEKVFENNKSRRAFISHITLGRFKNLKNPIQKQPVNWHFEAKEIALYESLPTRIRGSRRYKILHTIKLNE